ncbi:CRISPR-associated protein Csx19 [Picosynechococcus sp. NKBG042902]|uniref:type III-D CRISPR-associated protein Csx19 n=1 Tax=Picosynechococcus sp. NKBG042902 TaxID=490193 RepID=UPI0005F02C02|nr:CRISPR-associated protein Csx19 [Picosynechococcus sp. NKBG042902]
MSDQHQKPQLRDAILYRYTSKNNLTLSEAIAAGSDYLEKAIALLYSPEGCTIAQLNNGQLQNSEGKILEDIKHVFEARIFNEQSELRWLNQALVSGQAVFISEQSLNLNNFDAQASLNSEALEQKYLLWGEKVNNKPSAAGWLRLAEARIGKLDIPLADSVAKDQRVYLITNEYIAPEEVYGNYGAIEERLVKLEVK